MPHPIKLSDRVYSRLKALSDRSGTSMAQLVAEFVSKSHKKEVKSTSEKEKDTYECDECEEVVPDDASFCPYCGVEFEEEEEEAESEG